MTNEIKALLKEYWDRGYKYIFQTCDEDIFITKLSFTDSASTEFLFSKHSKEAIYCPLTTFRELFDETPFRRIRINELIDEVDWYSVKKDTPVIIQNSRETYNAHFCKYEKGKVYVFLNGMTSWTARNTDKNTIYYLPKHSRAYLAPMEKRYKND